MYICSVFTVAAASQLQQKQDHLQYKGIPSASALLAAAAVVG
jgi:hypothetical protein